MLEQTDNRLALKAYEQVLNIILSGQARPGDLVNERRLAEMLEMSRTPIRDALLMLEAEGLLVRQGKRGLQIKHMKLDDFMDALQIRLLLEPMVARMAAGKVADDALEALADEFETLIAEADGAKTEVDRETVRSIDNRLHGLITDAAGNQQLSTIIRGLRRQTQIFDLRSVPERLVDTCREHLSIIDAIRAGDAEMAADAMTHHLEAVRASIIARLTAR